MLKRGSWFAATLAAFVVFAPSTAHARNFQFPQRPILARSQPEPTAPIVGVLPVATRHTAHIADAQSAEEGQSKVIPWSGWWWPATKNNLVDGYLQGEAGPLVKYDQATGGQASAWEKSQVTHYDPAPNAPDWWGHCHAYAASSFTELEPKHDVNVNGTIFHVGDIKGLLAESHYSDQAAFYGLRYNGAPTDDSQDLYPLDAWQVCRQFLQSSQTPIVFDLVPNAEIWSYPTYHYRVDFQPIDGSAYQQYVAAATPYERRQPAGIVSGATFYQGTMLLDAVTFQVHPDTVGTKVERHTYTFVFQAAGNQLVANSDHWIGSSIQDHPDFAWYPTARVGGNPNVDYNFVVQLDKAAQ